MLLLCRSNVAVLCCAVLLCARTMSCSGCGALLSYVHHVDVGAQLNFVPHPAFWVLPATKVRAVPRASVEYRLHGLTVWLNSRDQHIAGKEAAMPDPR